MRKKNKVEVLEDGTFILSGEGIIRQTGERIDEDGNTIISYTIEPNEEDKPESDET